VTVRDPLLITNEDPIPEQRIPDRWKAKYMERSPHQLAVDVVRAFDQQHELRKLQRRDKDLIIGELVKTRRSLKWAKFQVWALTGATVAELSVIGWLFKAFLDRFGR